MGAIAWSVSAFWLTTQLGEAGQGDSWRLCTPRFWEGVPAKVLPKPGRVAIGAGKKGVAQAGRETARELVRVRTVARRMERKLENMEWICDFGFWILDFGFWIGDFGLVCSHVWIGNAIGGFFPVLGSKLSF
jgi:hypothetical protein